MDDLGQTFWDQNIDSAVVRFFPAADTYPGIIHPSGAYWTASDSRELSAGSAYALFFCNTECYTGYGDLKTYHFAVRLFSDRPVE